MIGLVREMWEKFVALEEQVETERLFIEGNKKETDLNPVDSICEKLSELDTTLCAVDTAMTEASEVEHVVAPEQRRLNMWLGDLEELNQKLHSTHGYRVTLEEVINHLKQWDKR